jgi:hypothetical protein
MYQYVHSPHTPSHVLLCASEIYWRLETGSLRTLKPEFFSTYLTENAPYFHYNYQWLEFIFTQKFALFF